jgi:DNA replication protein DnaC
MTMTTTLTETELQQRRQRLRALNLYGLFAQHHEVLSQDWVQQLIDIEERERHSRSLKRRLANARIGTFKPIADFDWQWPSHVERPLIEELFNFSFCNDAVNLILLGPNGIGKTMLAQNLTHQAVLKGFTARFTTASDMLHELAAQDSDASLARRLRRYTQPHLLAIDEVGYLAYDNRYADLLFEVVTRRYLTRPIILTTNKPFSQWGDVFPNAACVVTLVDRLVHRSELITLEGESYRLKEAKERAAQRAKARRARQTKPETE